VSKITAEGKGHILLMGLNRPEKMNDFDPEMYYGLFFQLP
jgi:enoyl-CoA hydratase/carnithine racemase